MGNDLTMQQFWPHLCLPQDFFLLHILSHRYIPFSAENRNDECLIILDKFYF